VTGKAAEMPTMLKSSLRLADSQGVTDTMDLRTHGAYPNDPHIVIRVRGVTIEVRAADLLKAVKAVCTK